MKTERFTMRVYARSIDWFLRLCLSSAAPFWEKHKKMRTEKVQTRYSLQTMRQVVFPFRSGEENYRSCEFKNVSHGQCYCEIRPERVSNVCWWVATSGVAKERLALYYACVFFPWLNDKKGVSSRFPMAIGRISNAAMPRCVLSCCSSRS